MSAVLRIALVLFLAAALGAGAAAAAEREPPGELWKEFPLVPTEPERSLPLPAKPTGGVAGVSAERRSPRPATPGAAAALPAEDTTGGLAFALLLGTIAAAVLLLAASLLPAGASRGPKLIAFAADRRVDLAIAGAALVLLSTLAYYVAAQIG